ncbi:MAG: MurR/RpiR family transcriptional regulator [Peptostreptococcaceae bacterium]|nr:MurR/RpiR family transcriptional regulator [Peptostreptococcaceae bacterium]
MRYISIIQSFYPSLSKGEKKIADYVIAEKDQIIYQTLQEISKSVGVGEATIVRFCHKIGFEGFHDFKLTVAKEVPTSTTDEGVHYVDYITMNLQNAISNTKQILEKEKIEKAVDLICSADRVFIYGIGTSGNASLDMQSRLLRYGKMANVVTDSHFQAMTSSVLGEKDLVIAFSLSGYTQDIVESLSLAKNNGAKVVTITNHTLSPAAELADIVILSAGKESPMDGGSLSGRVSQLYIIDLLCTGYAMRDLERAYTMRERSANSVVKKSLEYKKRNSGGTNG